MKYFEKDKSTYPHWADLRKWRSEKQRPGQKIKLPCPTMIAAYQRYSDSIRMDTEKDTSIEQSRRDIMRQKGGTLARAPVSSAGCDHCMKHWKKRGQKEAVCNNRDAIILKTQISWLLLSKPFRYQAFYYIYKTFLNSLKKNAGRVITLNYVCKI